MSSPTPSEGPDDAAIFEQMLAPLRDSKKTISIGRDNPTTPRPKEHALTVDESSDPLVVVKGLSKSFDDQAVVQNLSFSLWPGDILGLLGPNGAGKTTTLRLLATILQADEGHATLAGHPLTSPQKIRPLLGYMPDFLGNYDDLKVEETMEFYARAYGIKPKDRAHAIEQALTNTELLALHSHPVSELSRGEQQRLGLARVLMHNPRILLLDEPASGLDPRARAHFRELLRTLSTQGKAIIISSHILEDLSDLCTKVAIIDGGRLIRFGPTHELLSRLHRERRWRLRALTEPTLDGIQALLNDHPQVSDVTKEGLDLYLQLSGDDLVAEALLHEIIRSDFRLVEFTEIPLTLEELYLRLIGKES